MNGFEEFSYRYPEHEGFGYGIRILPYYWDGNNRIKVIVGKDNDGACDIVGGEVGREFDDFGSCVKLAIDTQMREFFSGLYFRYDTFESLGDYFENICFGDGSGLGVARRLFLNRWFAVNVYNPEQYGGFDNRVELAHVQPKELSELIGSQSMSEVWMKYIFGQLTQVVATSIFDGLSTTERNNLLKIINQEEDDYLYLRRELLVWLDEEISADSFKRSAVEGWARRMGYEINVPSWVNSLREARLVEEGKGITYKMTPRGHAVAEVIRLLDDSFYFPDFDDSWAELYRDDTEGRVYNGKSRRYRRKSQVRWENKGNDILNT